MRWQELAAATRVQVLVRRNSSGLHRCVFAVTSTAGARRVRDGVIEPADDRSEDHRAAMGRELGPLQEDRC
jgi:hypothetical protein